MKFFEMAFGCDALLRQFSAECQMSKTCFSTHTDVGDNMLMIMIRYLPGQVEIELVRMLMRMLMTIVEHLSGGD